MEYYSESSRRTWRRGRRLGRGCSGFVSLAVLLSHPDDDDHQHSLMAVKSAKVSHSRSLKKERKLLHEFESCSDHILRCFGDDLTMEDGVQLYNILLEYASGGSLADRIRSLGGKGLPENEIRKHTKSALMGLSHIHKHGYVHCDIKPHNILLVGNISSSSSASSLIPRLKKVEETAKIADFGLARKAGQKGKVKEGHSGLRGTPLYMAPESILHQEYVAESDIWALGCTVLQLITGKQPWDCKPKMELWALLYRIGCTNQVPEIPSWVSKEAEDFLNKCFVRDPKSRWSADMLLGHPFVSSIIDGNIRINKGIKEERNKVYNMDDSSSPQSSLDDDLPKPYAVMSKFASLKKLVTGKGSFSDSWTPLSQKRKRTMEEVQEQNSISGSGMSFGLRGYRRYWGVKRVSIYDSKDAIPVGF